MRWTFLPASRSRRGLSQHLAPIAAALRVAALLIPTCWWLQPAQAEDEAAIVEPPAGQTQVTDPADVQSPDFKLTETSTLLQWKVASASERSRMSVAMARKHLPAEATKLELATAAMEITGCLTATAKDLRLAAWTLAPTAKTCLTAPERPAK